MTFDQISLLLLCLTLTISLLVNRAPIDLIAVLGLLCATFLGLVPPERAFSGFSSAAVVTMVAVFFLSAAMRSSGANEACGDLIFKISKGKRTLALLLTVLTSAFVSSFMNNVAAVALLLPGTIVLARRLGLAPAQLLLPMSFGAILGGMTTLMGTPPNLIASDILHMQGLESFHASDFFSSGIFTLIAGGLVIVLLGPKLLPKMEDRKSSVVNPELEKLYELFERAYAIRIPSGSALVGRSLIEIGASVALDAQVVAVIRESESVLAPMPEFRFRDEDLVILGGEQDDLILLKNFASFEAVDNLSTLNPSFSSFTGALITLKSTESHWDLERLSGLGAESSIIPLFIRRLGKTIRWKASELIKSDEIIVLGSKDALDQLRQSQSLEVDLFQSEIHDFVSRSVFAFKISESSPEGVLRACDLLKQRLGISLLALQREEKLIDVEQRAVEPQQGDVLLFLGEGKKIKQLKDLLSVEAVEKLPVFHLESGNIGISEIVLSPRSKLVGQSLSELNFRERYGFRVLSLWRDGKPLFQGLSSEALKFGDALLLHGPRQHLDLLRDDPDFLVLSNNSVSTVVPWKIATVVIAAALLVLLPLFNIASVQFAAVISACFVCCCGTVKVSEAYRQIEWRVVFFTAALLPFSYAIEKTGLATLLSEQLKYLLGEGAANPYLIIVSLGLVSSLISQLLDGPVAVILVAPIAISLAKSFGLHPEPIVLMVAQSASVTFLFPISHKAHLLVLGPGAYRARDFFRIGFFVSIAVFVALAISISLFHPLF
jgi:di/tricarboxylate transporter